LSGTLVGCTVGWLPQVRPHKAKEPG